MTTALLLGLLTLPLASGAPASALRLAPSFEEALETGRRQNRPVVVFFHTRWCGWCRKMERHTFRDPEVVRRSKDELVFVSVDAEDRRGEPLAARFGVRGYPLAVLLSPQGVELDRISGFRSGPDFLRDIDRTLAELKTLGKLLAKEKDEPNEPGLLFELAATLERLSRNDEALERYAALLKLGPERAGAYRESALWNAARLLAERGERQRAIGHYREFVEIARNETRREEAYFELGRQYHLSGQLEEASQAYETLLERYPESRFAPTIKVQLKRLRSH